MVWRLLSNKGIVYVALGELAKKEHYLSLTTGMAGYGISLGLEAVGFATFFMNCDPNFDRSLFWRPKSGQQHARDAFNDVKIREKGCKTKDDEHWGWIGFIHPTYLPFDCMTPWVCERLVEKYEDKSVGRPEWMNEENEDTFIKRIAEIYTWKGSHGEEVNKALNKLFGKSGADLEVGLDGQVTFIKSPNSNSTKKNGTPLRIQADEDDAKVTPRAVREDDDDEPLMVEMTTAVASTPRKTWSRRRIEGVELNKWGNII
ncbi:hypothetical protein TrLO_g8290 [Triparma laevis f. longispina]|uniref:Uncharacterized protein n=1 Tax=Triparma laevis f. longispina TaxID=1714387 RepID=A0A9W7A2A1_9STRA|nr:hypothetical protein TrLO_g8290 [Triparma laevis f. longispina]